MSAAQLLADAKAAGISVVLDGDTVRLRAAGRPDPVLLGRLKEAKLEIVAFLEAGPAGSASGLAAAPRGAGDDRCRWYHEQYDWVLAGKLRRRRDRVSAMLDAWSSCVTWWCYKNPRASRDGAIAGLAACGIVAPPARQEAAPHADASGQGGEGSG